MRYGCVTVADNGPGMDVETQSRIFEPYYSTKETGHGFGLAITMGIVIRHSGLVCFQTGPTGTTISLLFPLEESQDKPVATDQTPSLESGSVKISPHTPD